MSCRRAASASRGVAHFWIGEVAFEDFEVADFTVPSLLPLGRGGLAYLSAVDDGTELLLGGWAGFIRGTKGPGQATQLGELVLQPSLGLARDCSSIRGL